MKNVALRRGKDPVDSWENGYYMCEVANFVRMKLLREPTRLKTVYRIFRHNNLEDIFT